MDATRGDEAELQWLKGQRTVCKGNITRNLRMLEGLLRQGASRKELLQSHADELLRNRNRAAELCQRMVEIDPESADAVNEWLDREFERVQEVVVDVESSASSFDGESSVRSRDVSPTGGKTKADHGIVLNRVKETPVRDCRYDLDFPVRTEETPVRDCRYDHDYPVKSEVHDSSVNEWLNRCPAPKVSQNQFLESSHPLQSWYFGKSLPKLQLPQFDGDPLKWSDWYGMFQAMVHNTPMSDTEKLTHLQNSCIKRAKEE
ncbi:MAG: hypothetical protein MJA29_13400, partial [Candidatus Omnitrophica bacterium]|nr:hypothetical protein [Candidatus Omnitrophota bacterium]